MWLQRPFRYQDETDWGSFGSRFGPQVRDDGTEESPSVRRWNEAETSHELPEPRWERILGVIAGASIACLGIVAMVWWLSTIPHH